MTASADFYKCLACQWTFSKLDPQRVLDTMMHDKKAEHGQLRFVLPSCLGRAEVVGDIAIADIRAVLE